MPRLTPYDTGARCEPKSWVTYGTNVSALSPAENFGKVDFNDDTDETVCTTYVEKNADGTHTVHVQSMCAADELNVKLHTENGVIELAGNVS